MKTMHKRVLALIMALVLMFSCTAFASAAEVAPDDGLVVPAIDEMTLIFFPNPSTSVQKTHDFSIGVFAKANVYLEAFPEENCVIHVAVKKRDGTIIRSISYNLSREYRGTFKVTTSDLGWGNYTVEAGFNRAGVPGPARIYIS